MSTGILEKAHAAIVLKEALEKSLLGKIEERLHLSEEEDIAENERSVAHCINQIEYLNSVISDSDLGEEEEEEEHVTRRVVGDEEDEDFLELSDEEYEYLFGEQELTPWQNFVGCVSFVANWSFLLIGVAVALKYLIGG